jgi:putative SOS response-associated peptidase YedK
MCGRYVAAAPPSEIAKYFGAAAPTETVLEPSYNVAPTNEVYAVVERNDERVLDHFRWGLVPLWAKDLAIGSKMINARAEGIATKNAYRHAFRKQRCIIPADGFYEWKVVEGAEPRSAGGRSGRDSRSAGGRSGRVPKQPMYIHRVDGEPLAFAGLWETWRGPDRDGDPLYTCTIITTTANETMAPVHDRMPVILPPDLWDKWLDPEMRDTDELIRFLQPAPASLLTLYPISTAVNNVRNKGVEIIVPKDELPAPGQLTLES